MKNHLQTLIVVWMQIITALAIVVAVVIVLTLSTCMSVKSLRLKFG